MNFQRSGLSLHISSLNLVSNFQYEPWLRWPFTNCWCKNINQVTPSGRHQVILVCSSDKHNIFAVAQTAGPGIYSCGVVRLPVVGWVYLDTPHNVPSGSWSAVTCKQNREGWDLVSLKGTVVKSSFGARISRTTQGPLMSSCKHFVTFPALSRLCLNSKTECDVILWWGKWSLCTA